MTVPRSIQISLEHTPYYHCTTRCVRRAFLCGKDRYTGKNFGHRKQWLENRIVRLSEIFAIDVLAYAIMSNHYHVVVRLRSDSTKKWSDEEVRKRWGAVFSVPDNVTIDQIAIWRERLRNLSWFMRCLNEPLARFANHEDDCKGRFWEGRFRCQALLDETAVIRCMAYVDLNPIRAAVANTPEESRHTSVCARLDGRDRHLAPFADTAVGGSEPIPIRQQDYLKLIDWTGRQLLPEKRGRIPETLPPILTRLNVESDRWIIEMQYYGKWYYRAVGSVQKMDDFCKHLGQKWLKGNPGPAQYAT